MDPPDGLRTPEIAFTVVVFPAPLAPNRATISPVAISKDTSHNTGTAPYETLRFLILSMPVTEVSGDHLLISDDFIGPTISDLHAVVENDDSLRNTHDDLHDMLDEQNRNLEVLVDSLDEVDGFQGLRWIQARHDFVKQQYLWVGR